MAIEGYLGQTPKKEKLEFPTNPFLQFEWELNELIKKFEKKDQASIRGYFVMVDKNALGNVSDLILAPNISEEKIHNSLHYLISEISDCPAVYSRTVEEIEDLESQLRGNNGN